MSTTYSFKNVNVFLTIDTPLSIGPIPIGVPINLASKDFYGKEGAITITPNPMEISSNEMSIEGDSLPDMSNNKSGTAIIQVGDLSSAHYLLTTIFNFQKQGLLVRDIGINVVQNPLGDTGNLLGASLLYSCGRGFIQGLPSKGWGARQNGNGFNLFFEKVNAVTTVSAISNVLSFL